MQNLYVVGYRGPGISLHDVTNVSEDSLNYIAEFMEDDELDKLSDMRREGWSVPAIFATVVSMRNTIRAKYFIETLALR